LHVSRADRVEAYVESVTKLLRAFRVDFNDAPGTLQNYVFLKSYF